MVRRTDRLSMTIAVDWDIIPPKQKNKAYIKTDGYENIHNFPLKKTVYLVLCINAQLKPCHQA